MIIKKVAIGVGTSQRPQMLASSLLSLTRLIIPENIRLTLLVIDNAPENSVHEVFESFQYPFEACYFQEPQIGIVHMRNRLVEESIRLNMDYLAFIDDDEVASPDWIHQMMHTLESYQADVVSGKINRELPPEIPSWIVQGNFFEKKNHPTGTLRKTSSTCNVLFDLKKICIDWKLRFDMRLNMVGSSDILFFRQAHDLGARIVWLNEALVTETIPQSRSTKEWLVQRAYRMGNTMAVRYKIQNPLWLAHLKGITFAIGEWFMAGAYLFGIRKTSDPNIRATKKLHHLNISLGILNGFYGRQIFEEYKQHHGN